MKLSALGKSRNFDGELSDGKRKVRVVGFDSKVREKLFDCHGKRKPVVVSNCQVKSGKYSSDLEIFVKKSTELQKSPTKFDIAEIMFVTDEHVVTISEISKLANYQRVTLRVKVLHEGKVQTVKSNLCKQEYIHSHTIQQPRPNNYYTYSM